MKNITITTARNMSEQTYDAVCDGFRRKFGTDFTFQRVTDDGIIGGFIADINGEVYDLSIASQLKRMEKHIAG